MAPMDSDSFAPKFLNAHLIGWFTLKRVVQDYLYTRNTKFKPL